jgi:hypothetical protein
VTRQGDSRTGPYHAPQPKPKGRAHVIQDTDVRYRNRIFRRAGDPSFASRAGRASHSTSEAKGNGHSPIVKNGHQGRRCFLEPRLNEAAGRRTRNAANAQRPLQKAVERKTGFGMINALPRPTPHFKDSASPDSSRPLRPNQSCRYVRKRKRAL